MHHDIKKHAFRTKISVYMQMQLSAVFANMQILIFVHV